MIQDIKKPKKSLREVLPESRFTDLNSNNTRKSEVEYDLVTELPHRSRRLWYGLVVVVILLAGGLFLFSSRFTSAKVYVTPRVSERPLNIRERAYQAPPPGGLAYQLVTMKATADRQTRAVGAEKLERKATGHVTLYNNFGPEPQKLVINTRLESPEHKIFRLVEAVTIPGYTKVGAEVTPGSIEASVRADQAGPEYNIPAGDFTIPGFASDPRFNKFKATSQAAMSGGFRGEVKVVPPTEEEKIRQELRASLKEKLITDVAAQIPDGFVLYDNASFLQFADPAPPVDVGTGDQVKLMEEVVFTGVIFKRAELTGVLLAALEEATSTPPNLKQEIVNLDDLEFNLLDQKKLGEAGGEITFNLKGNLRLTAQIDKNQIAEALVGKKKNEYSSLLQSFSEIEMARADLTPSWANYFPGQTNRITVEVARPE